MARHPARTLTVDGIAVGECTVCGGRVVGFGATLRHEGERTPVLVPEPEDARAVALAHEQAVAAARVLGSDGEVARAIVDALYAGGFLRRRRGDRHRSVLLDEPPPRELDHAERAAGERISA